MLKYKFFVNKPDHEPSIYDTENCLWIGIDETNRHYQQYLAWLAEGNTPEEWNPEEVE